MKPEPGSNKPSQIKAVYKWSNQMIMVFDQNGEQIPELQGRYSEVRDKILVQAPDDCEFYEGEWRDYAYRIERSAF